MLFPIFRFNPEANEKTLHAGLWYSFQVTGRMLPDALIRIGSTMIP